MGHNHVRHDGRRVLHFLLFLPCRRGHYQFLVDQFVRRGYYEHVFGDSVRDEEERFRSGTVCGLLYLPLGRIAHVLHPGLAPFSMSPMKAGRSLLIPLRRTAGCSEHTTIPTSFGSS